MSLIDVYKYLRINFLRYIMQYRENTSVSITKHDQGVTRFDKMNVKESEISS